MMISIEKSIPNAITLLRIIFSLMLLFQEIRTISFFLLYGLCILSDILDGYLARKLNCSTTLGATFDSIADFIFAGVMMIRLIPMVDGPSWIFTWIGFLFLFRILSLLIGGIRYHTIAFLHTTMNKITGLILVLFPVLFFFLNIEKTAIVLCFIASVATFEELLINSTAPILNRDIKSIFIENKE